MVQWNRVCLSLCPFIVCIKVSTPSQKCHSPLSANCPSLSSPHPPPLFLGNIHPLYWFFVNSPTLKVRFFSEHPKYQSFSSLNPSYFLKPISQEWIKEFWLKRYGYKHWDCGLAGEWKQGNCSFCVFSVPLLLEGSYRFSSVHASVHLLGGNPFMTYTQRVVGRWEG